jgi:hypothetical protein
MPLDMWLEFCKEEHTQISSFFKSVQVERFSVPTFALSFPPPICDSVFILGDDFIREVLAGRRLAAASWRYRTWKSHALALHTIYQENGVPFIDPPRESQGEDGCLLQPFWADPFHANSRYGHLLLRQLSDLFTNAG